MSESPWPPLRRQCERFARAYDSLDADATVLGSIAADLEAACADVRAYWRERRAEDPTVTVTGPQRVRAALGVVRGAEDGEGR